MFHQSSLYDSTPEVIATKQPNEKHLYLNKIMDFSDFEHCLEHVA